MNNSPSYKLFGEVTWAELDCSWDKIIESMGDSTLLSVSTRGYEGDTYAIVKKGDKYGYVQVSWGSCSGCDALYACDNNKEVDELIERVSNSVEWFDSLPEAYDKLSNKQEQEIRHTWHTETYHEFIKQLKEKQ